MAEAGSNTDRTILLVEGEALIAMNQAAVLEKHGYAVRTVYSGEQAIEAAGGTGIDLILMDIDLGRGKMDGTEAAEIILKDNDIPVVFLSSHTEPEIVAKTEKITSYGYVAKDSGETVLLASIKMAFRLYEAYRERIEKSNQLNTLLDNAEDLIGRLDRNKTHLYVNQALCDIMGIPYREYVGKRIEDLGGPAELSQKWNDAVDRVFETGKPVQIEFGLPDAGGERTLDCKIVPELVEDGEVKTVVAISRDISERKKAEVRISQSEELFSKAFHSGPVLMAISSIEDGTYIEVNDNFIHTTGYTREDAIGKKSVDIGFITPEDRKHLKFLLGRDGKISGLELHLKKKSGDFIKCLYYGEIIEVDGVRRLLSIGQDITEGEKTEKKFRSLVQNTIDWVWQVDAKGRYTYIGSNIEQIIGYTPEELIGYTPFDLMEEDERQRVLSIFTPIAEKMDKIIGLEDTMIHKAGHPVIFETNATPLFNEKGDFEGYFGTCRDITERKKMEAELRKSNAIFNEAQEIADIGSYVWNLRTDALEWSRNMFTIAGLDPENFYGNLQETIGKMIHPDDRESVFKQIAAMIEKKETWKMEFRLVRPDGDVRWLRSGSRFVFDEKGIPVRNIGVHHDITERKQAEKELQNVLNSISDGIAVIDRDFNILRTNKALLDDIGAEVNSELIGRKCYAAFYGRDTFCEWCPAKEVFRTGKEQSSTVPFPTDNPVRWFDLKASPVRNIRGEVIQVVEVARDLTEQKKIEEALKSSEKQKDVILNATAEMVAYYDINLQIIWANRSAAESVGKSPEELLGMYCYEIWHNRTEPCESCPVLKALETEKPQQLEQRTPDGRFWFVRGYPVFDENGNVSNLVEFGQDITESKKAEEKLKASEEFRGRIIQSLVSGLYIYNLQEGRNDFITPQYIQLTGWTLDEINGMGAKFNELFHPEDLPRVIEHFAEMAEAPHGEVLEVEYRFRRKDGEWIWCVSRDTVFERDEKGAVLRFIGSFFDITERKRAEEERMIHEERLEALLKLNEMDSTNQDELAEFALEESVRLTKSEIGFINFLSKDEKYVTRAIYTKNTLKQCKLPEDVSAFEISGCGLWSEAYRKRRPVIVNDYKMPHLSKVGFPEGHPVLRRFISIPIFEGDRIVAVAALGNKETEYTERDVRELRLFIEGFEQIIQRRKMEEQLRCSLAEKDSLMAELNHRVKNNLAIISSLINLKNSALGNRVDLSDIKHQIDAVRIVHEKLYKSRDITHIELKDYLQDLLTTVFSSFSAVAVEIENRIEDVRMPTRRAVPVGLITNEIATNAIKYGFTDEEGARFTVDLSLDKDEGQYVLVLSSTGNPFPEGIDLDNPETLGLRLISALVNQLDGTIELKRKPNPRFTIRFPM